MTFPSPRTRNPVKLSDGTAHGGTVFLSAATDHPRIRVGDYSYASAHVPPDDWAGHLAPYLYDFSPERLIIGKFCQIADGVTFITASANHRHDGFSSFPFMIFTGGGAAAPSMPPSGPDTAVGHDVWIGQGARIMPDAQIGNGLIIGAGAVVTGAIPDYAIVGGNPGRVLRTRFGPEIIETLNALAWWDWDIDTITAQEAVIAGGNLKALQAVGPA